MAVPLSVGDIVLAAHACTIVVAVVPTLVTKVAGVVVPLCVDDAVEALARRGGPLVRHGAQRNAAR